MASKTYVGTVADNTVCVDVYHGFKFIRSYNLPLYLEVSNHSPTGFSWGYAGSGPAQLALAILMDHLKPAANGKELALALHQQFKSRFIAVADQNRDIKITSTQIDTFLKEVEIGTYQHR